MIFSKTNILCINMKYKGKLNYFLLIILELQNNNEVLIILKENNYSFWLISWRNSIDSGSSWGTRQRYNYIIYFKFTHNNFWLYKIVIY